MGFFHMRLEIQSQAYATTMSLVEVEAIGTAQRVWVWKERGVWCFLKCIVLKYGSFALYLYKIVFDLS